MRTYKEEIENFIKSGGNLPKLLIANDIVGICKLLGLDEFDNCHITLITDVFWLMLCIALLKQI